LNPPTFSVNGTNRPHHRKSLLSLKDYQAILKPSKFGYSLGALIDEKLVEVLEQDRTETIKWAESKLKNPKRSTLKPEPWEEVSEGKYKVKFSWNEETRPPVVDTEGTPITDDSLPLYSGSKVKLAFRQKPYILRDGITYGTTPEACRYPGRSTQQLCWCRCRRHG
jgi:hypothetical protein